MTYTASAMQLPLLVILMCLLPVMLAAALCFTILCSSANSFTVPSSVTNLTVSFLVVALSAAVLHAKHKYIPRNR